MEPMTSDLYDFQGEKYRSEWLGPFEAVLVGDLRLGDSYGRRTGQVQVQTGTRVFVTRHRTLREDGSVDREHGHASTYHVLVPKRAGGWRLDEHEASDLLKASRVDGQLVNVVDDPEYKRAFEDYQVLMSR